MERLPGWVIRSMPGPPPRQHKHERQYTPRTHSVKPTKRTWKDDYDDQMIFGDLGGLKFPDICLTGEEKPRKNFTQETCPDRGSNRGPLRDKRSCYHLLHSGGQSRDFWVEKFVIFWIWINVISISNMRLGMLNKQSWTADRGGLPALGLVEGLTTPHRKEKTFCSETLHWT